MLRFKEAIIFCVIVVCGILYTWADRETAALRSVPIRPSSQPAFRNIETDERTHVCLSIVMVS